MQTLLNPYHRRYRLGWFVLAVALDCLLALAQPIPEVIGIGLSGSPTARDTVVEDSDSLYLIISHTPSTYWTVSEIGLAAATRNQVLLHGYTGPACTGARIMVLPVNVDRITYVFMPDSVPPRLSVRASLKPLVDGRVLSFQAELAVMSNDTAHVDTFSAHRVSYVTVPGAIETQDSVDELHSGFITFRDSRTVPPELLEPVDRSSISRFFDVVYSQPEWADTFRLYLVIENVDPDAHEQHILTLEDFSDGANKRVQLDAFHLGDSPDVHSLSGGDSLTPDARFRFLIAYSDVNNNPEAADSAITIQADFLTLPPNLIEPRQGSESGDSTVLVIYQLPEAADSVWLSFVMDTLSVRVDTLEHHLLLNRENYFAGLHTLLLDGRSIGTGSDHIEYNPNGFDDRLISQVVYNVSLSYGDLAGNENSGDTEQGYIWPQDATTLTPTIEAPITGQRFNQTVWIQVQIPEAPLPGSVVLSFIAIGGTDPGSPRTVHLGELASRGRTGFFLNAADLLSSDLVTSVEGAGTPGENNQLYDGSRYTLRVGYQDLGGNAMAYSFVRVPVYDNSTSPVIINSPAEGDTISYAGLLVNWDQDEVASPGTLRISLTQTGGPEFDTGSPHTVFLSDVSAENDKIVVLVPLQLSFGVGIDSVQGGESLVQRGVYMLTIEYRDALANPPQAMSVTDLRLPSGSSVLVRGGSLGVEPVVPGEVDRLAFYLGLTAQEGQSALRAVSFSVGGDMDPADLQPAGTRLWWSQDSVFSPGADQQIAVLGPWFGGAFEFSGFSVPLSGSETFLFTSISFAAAANAYHRVRLSVASPQQIDCGGDPVISTTWPIGMRDIALPVTFTGFTTEQDTAFGALRVIWTVASELNNEGFNLYRRLDGDTTYIPTASFTDYSQLVGRGTAATAWRYVFTERGLTPGVRYFYRVDAVSVGGEVSRYSVEAEGVPRVPPANFSLLNAFPNPFNRDVTIKYVIPRTAAVELIVYDLTGRTVRTLVRALQPASEYAASWDSRDDHGMPLPSGVYFYRLRAGSIFDETRKLLLLR
ncbi:T9SS type A sorting domain-containing protein [candidate division KSB1 bacterium]|nr:T9SS type A sorting domain-containing protein [candidate division KSB1 bacterium]